MSRGAVFLIIAFLMSFVVGPLAQQAPPDSQRPPALKIGSRVGVPEKSGYDDGGRRDPFASLISERVTASPGGEPGVARPKGLAGVAVVDVAVKGIMGDGKSLIAIVAGPDGASYLAHTNDKLYDGVIRRIDRDAVVFLARVPDGTGKIVSREVRKGLRPVVGGGR